MSKSNPQQRDEKGLRRRKRKANGKRRMETLKARMAEKVVEPVVDEDDG